MQLSHCRMQDGASLGGFSQYRDLRSPWSSESHLLTPGLGFSQPGSRTNRNIDSCQVQRVLMSQICFSLVVQGIVDSLLIHTGLLRVSPCPCLFCFERRFGNWITREIHIWVWFKDQQVGAVSSGLGLGFGSERTKPLFTRQGKDSHHCPFSATPNCRLSSPALPCCI